MIKMPRFFIVWIAMITLPIAAQDPTLSEPQIKKSNAPGFSFLLRAAYMMPTENAFKEIYGNPQAYSIELCLGKKKLGIWLEGSRIKSEGKLTSTEDITRLTIVPVEAGLLFRFANGSLVPYIGAGAGYYSYEENNDLGSVHVKEIGYVGVGGLSCHLGSFIIDLKAKYSYCKIKPGATDENIEPIEHNIGGLSFSFGLGLGF